MQTENTCHLGHYYDVLIQKSRQVSIQLRSLKQDNNPTPTECTWPFLDRGHEFLRNLSQLLINRKYFQPLMGYIITCCEYVLNYWGDRRRFWKLFGWNWKDKLSWGQKCCWEIQRETLKHKFLRKLGQGFSVSCLLHLSGCSYLKVTYLIK